MGLSEAGENRRDTAPFLGWLLPAVLLLASLLPMLFGNAARAALRFDREDIMQGETWRLLSGHFVHLGWTHFLLNAAGLLLVWYLVGRGFDWLGWLLIVLASIVAIDAGLWYLHPELEWYVGLSGLLHGMLAAGAAALWKQRRGEAIALGAIVGLKLVYEQWLGPLPGSESTSGGAVIVDAHLYGVVGGLLVAAILTRGARTASL